MNVIEHGHWTLYVPARPYYRFEAAAAQGLNVLYARRAGDDRDWYVYVNDENPFQDGSVRMIVHPQRDGWIVGAATFDATAAWPANALLLEVTDYTGTDPQADFGNKVYDAATGTFSDRVPPENPLPDVLKRLEALEGKR